MFQRSRRFIIMSEFKANSFCNENNDSAPDLVGITTFTSPYYFVPPSGSTAERPSSPAPGMLRFNTDIGRLEVWRNDHWATILGESPNLGDQNNNKLFWWNRNSWSYMVEDLAHLHLDVIGVYNYFIHLGNSTRLWKFNS